MRGRIKKEAEAAVNIPQGCVLNTIYVTVLQVIDLFM